MSHGHSSRSRGGRKASPPPSPQQQSSPPRKRQRRKTAQGDSSEEHAPPTASPGLVGPPRHRQRANTSPISIHSDASEERRALAVSSPEIEVLPAVHAEPASREGTADESDELAEEGNDAPDDPGRPPAPWFNVLAYADLGGRRATASVPEGFEDFPGLPAGKSFIEYLDEKAARAELTTVSTTQKARTSLALNLASDSVSRNAYNMGVLAQMASDGYGDADDLEHCRRLVADAAVGPFVATALGLQGRRAERVAQKVPYILSARWQEQVGSTQSVGPSSMPLSGPSTPAPPPNSFRMLPPSTSLPPSSAPPPPALTPPSPAAPPSLRPTPNAPSPPPPTLPSGPADALIGSPRAVSPRLPRTYDEFEFDGTPPPWEL